MKWTSCLVDDSFTYCLTQSTCHHEVSLWQEQYDDGPPIHFFGSKHLDAAQSREEVQRRAAGMVSLMNGIAAVVRIFQISSFQSGKYSPLPAGTWGGDAQGEILFWPLLRFSVFRSKDTYGVVDATLSDPFEDPFDPDIPLANDKDKDIVAVLLKMARSNSSTLQNLQHVGRNGANHGTLYKLVEEMKKVGGLNEAQIDAFSGEANGFTNRFTGTANNPATMGGRHSGQALKPMSKPPITLKEATPAILRAYMNYLLM